MVREEREFTFVLPKFDNSGNPIKADEIKNVAKDMSDRFGGVTISTSVLGCWKDNKGNLQCENNAILKSVRDCESDNSKELIKKEGLSGCKALMESDSKWTKSKSKEIGERLGQAEIFLTEDAIREATFVEGKWKKELSDELRRKWDSKTGFERQI